jgi:hypothetical protein
MKNSPLWRRQQKKVVVMTNLKICDQQTLREAARGGSLLAFQKGQREG